MSDLLEALAARAPSDPWFLGFALAAYQKRHALTDAELAWEPGCNDAAVLTLLRLCRRPGVAPGRTARQRVRPIPALLQNSWFRKGDAVCAVRFWRAPRKRTCLRKSRSG
jgi:hypothetical protein